MKKFILVKNTVPGETSSIKVGGEYDDPFLDSYQQEIFACCDTIDKMKLIPQISVNVVIDKRFLTSILKSYLNSIRKMNAD